VRCHVLFQKTGIKITDSADIIIDDQGLMVEDIIIRVDTLKFSICDSKYGFLLQDIQATCYHAHREADHQGLDCDRYGVHGWTLVSTGDCMASAKVVGCTKLLQDVL